ncbi:hypothetical protein I6F31_05660 [Bradyrhizobium sp. NBAIM01]|nr:hypothetical protein [Bradyrhizobium sp. NBAIM01]
MRSALAPNGPTALEAGASGYELAVWFGVVAPAGKQLDLQATQSFDRAVHQEGPVRWHFRREERLISARRRQILAASG